MTGHLLAKFQDEGSESKLLKPIRIRESIKLKPHHLLGAAFTVLEMAMAYSSAYLHGKILLILRKCDRRMEGRPDAPMNGPTDRPSYRDVKTHLRKKTMHKNRVGISYFS